MLGILVPSLVDSPGVAVVVVAVPATPMTMPIVYMNATCTFVVIPSGPNLLHMRAGKMKMTSTPQVAHACDGPPSEQCTLLSPQCGTLLVRAQC